jgi:hypothetical protein
VSNLDPGNAIPGRIWSHKVYRLGDAAIVVSRETIGALNLFHVKHSNYQVALLAFFAKVVSRETKNENDQ